MAADAAEILGAQYTQIHREYTYLDKAPGSDVSRRDSNHTRELTPTDMSLYRLVRANIDRLRQVASYESPPPNSTTSRH